MSIPTTLPLAGVRVLDLSRLVAGNMPTLQPPVGLMERRLRIDRSGPFLASPLFENTVFWTHSEAMGLQIR